jgi:hypothetical protein
MDGLQFLSAPVASRSNPLRADIACFVGFVACRRPASPAERANLEAVFQPPFSTTSIERFRSVASALAPEPVIEWWIENGWVSPHSGRPPSAFADLSDIPVPIDNWDTFDLLFAWEQRPLSAAITRLAHTALGAAVRRFFNEGGRRCYVVRVGDPWPALGAQPERGAARRRLLNDFPPRTPLDRTTWRGAAHLYGLPDVSILCMPDLPEVFAVDPPPTVEETEASPFEERFIECGTQASAATSGSLRAFPPPRCDARGYEEWAKFVRATGDLLRRYCREVQFVAALPLPAPDFDSRRALWTSAESIQTAFVQLAFPWLTTRESALLPGALEPPDAMLAGAVANSALIVGTWRTLARTRMPGVGGVEPILSEAEIRDAREGVSLFTETAKGFQLLSDSTTLDHPVYRHAEVSRLVAWIVRACRLEGEAATFTNSGESLWRKLTAALNDVLLKLWGEGALAGAKSSDAFEVRCDRSTMTQNDLDNGRTVVRIQFTSATSIGQITVLFAMDNGGQASLAAV